MISKVQIVSFLDISKKPPDLAGDEQKKSTSRIMATEEDDDEQDEFFPTKRLLKLILRDAEGKVIMAVEHEPESVPIRVQEGSWMNLDHSKISLRHSIAFLRKGALY